MTMLSLMEELTSTENKASFLRQAYNDSVMAYNTQREVFPSNIIASMFQFNAAELFAIEEPDKNWKFSIADAQERKHWKDYMHAYGKCLGATSTTHSPWHVVPADNKKNAGLVHSQIILDAYQEMEMRIPRPLRNVGGSSKTYASGSEVVFQPTWLLQSGGRDARATWPGHPARSLTQKPGFTLWRNTRDVVI